MRRVVIDADPGVDDFLALSIALRAPELRVEAVTTVGGNVALRHATRNALRALEAASRADVPVVPGAARPTRGWFTYAPHFHGPTGLTARLPAPDLSPAPGSAAAAIADLALSDDDPLTVIALGPLTNLARFIAARPEAAQRLERIVIMGGALDTPGNVTPHAEFNIWNDPEAARSVLGSGVPITLVGLDVCDRVALTRDDLPLGRDAVRRVMSGWFDAHPDRTGFSLCDPLAMAAFLEPSLVSVETVAVSVDTSDGPERGRTARAAGGAQVEAAVGVAADEARAFIVERLGR